MNSKLVSTQKPHTFICPVCENEFVECKLIRTEIREYIVKAKSDASNIPVLIVLDNCDNIIETKTAELICETCGARLRLGKEIEDDAEWL